MNGAIMFCAIAAMVALLTAGLWFGLANWLRAGPKTRSLLSVLFGQMIFGAALLVDGAPYNGVIFALFLIPLVALQAFVVLALESRDFGLDG
jgi:uncharacterized membrane protein (UPF0136 family)